MDEETMVKIEINAEVYAKLLNLAQKKRRKVENLMEQAIEYYMKNYQQIRNEAIAEYINNLHKHFG